MIPGTYTGATTGTERAIDGSMTTIMMRLAMTETRRGAIADVVGALRDTTSVAAASAQLGLSVRALYRLLATDVGLAHAVAESRRGRPGILLPERVQAEDLPSRAEFLEPDPEDTPDDEDTP